MSSDLLLSRIRNETQSLNLHILKRTGHLEPFDSDKIALAITKAYVAVMGSSTLNSEAIRDKVSLLTEHVVQSLIRGRDSASTLHIEDIQDKVELALMRQGDFEVARAYVLYREKHKTQRLESTLQAVDDLSQKLNLPSLTVTLRDGTLAPWDETAFRNLLLSCIEGLSTLNSSHVDTILHETRRNLYDGVSIDQAFKAAILACRTQIEREPEFTRATARLLLHTIRSEIFGTETYPHQSQAAYENYFPHFIKEGIQAELLDPQLAQFDLVRLAQALNASRDLQFDYIGLQTLYDRYFLHIQNRRIEMPQAFFMRVAMGLSLNEIDRDARAIEFYNVLSSFDFMSSTPTLFNSGTRRPQLSSCYLTTVPDDLDGIYESIKDNALLSKFAGGLGNDWTSVRSMGAHIKGTNGQSQGTIPFLKVVNDTAVAVNQGGKRKGAVCTYLETWHLDIEEFLDLRKNTGDDRRRTHDMNTANWIPDLFMKRVMEQSTWTLFSPHDVPTLHDLYGQSFERAYLEAERKTQTGEIKLFKTLPAVDLWRKMLSMLFETGHPWITFKDPCNVRSPQQHVGVVHSSNLCTEITLNTNDHEIAVCNLGSINLVAHLKEDQGRFVIDHDKLRHTVRLAMRMLDNVIDINFYPVRKARDSNVRHRPVGLGMMAFQDALYRMRLPYSSEEAMVFADQSMEAICYYAYEASSDLAVERGKYSTYQGSLWSQGILPFDSLERLAQERGGYLDFDRSATLNWELLRQKILRQGMRNSNCVAIAPTATISNIIGVDASIEPSFGNLSVKSNLSGEFTVINEYLVRDLKSLNLWDEMMVVDLKHFDGSIARIERIPSSLRNLYATAFETDPTWLIEAASRRQKWIDQAQSLNIYIAGASGKKLDETYKLAWTKGLKTTYYLRTISATSTEKSTVARSQLNAVSVHQSAPSQPQSDVTPATDIKFCSIDNPDCESCQ